MAGGPLGGVRAPCMRGAERGAVGKVASFQKLGPFGLTLVKLHKMETVQL